MAIAIKCTFEQLRQRFPGGITCYTVKDHNFVHDITFYGAIVPDVVYTLVDNVTETEFFAAYIDSVRVEKMEP